MDRATVETRVFRVLRWVVIAALVVVTLFPFYYMVLLSVRPIEEVLADPGRICGRGRRSGRSRRTRRCSPRSATAGRASSSSCCNSAMVSIAATVLTLLVSIPGAYAVSRLRFVGRRQVHFLFLAVYLFPAILLAIPLFVLFTRLGLRGSLFGLTIVYIAQTVPVSIYMLRNYLSTIPVSLEEAAAVDGYTRLQTIRQGDPAAGRARRHGERALRVHDRLERVPVRAAVPGRGPGRLDRVARPGAALRRHRGAARRC